MKTVQLTSKEIELIERAIDQYIQDHHLFDLPVDDEGNYYDTDLDGIFSNDTFTIRETLIVSSIMKKIYNLR